MGLYDIPISVSDRYSYTEHQVTESLFLCIKLHVTKYKPICALA